MSYENKNEDYEESYEEAGDILHCRKKELAKIFKKAVPSDPAAFKEATQAMLADAPPSTNNLVEHYRELLRWSDKKIPYYDYYGSQAERRQQYREWEAFWRENPDIYPWGVVGYRRCPEGCCRVPVFHSDLKLMEG